MGSAKIECCYFRYKDTDKEQFLKDCDEVVWSVISSTFSLPAKCFLTLKWVFVLF